jgi:hypothetical protein
MFDFSPAEFAILVRTMNEVFPEVTLWRRSFSPSFPVFALVARADAAPLDTGRIEAAFDGLAASDAIAGELWLRRIPLAAYVGNPGARRAHYERYPVNTDDRIPLEYLTPITEREHRGAGRGGVLAWLELEQMCTALLEAVPPESDPFLVRVGPAERDQVLAGLEYYRYETLRRMGRGAEAAAHLGRYRRLLGASAPPATD